MLVGKMLARIRAWLANLGLQWHIQLLTAVGLVAIVAFSFWVGQRAIEESTRQSLNRQLIVANLLASLVDQHLDSALTLLETIAKQSTLNPDNPLALDTPQHQSPLFQPGPFGRRLFWLDAAGQILWTEPFDATLLSKPFSDFPTVRLAFEEGIRQVSNLCQPSDSSQPYILLAVPVVGPTGEIDGLLVEQVGTDQLGLTSIIDRATLNGSVYVEVVDYAGMALVSNVPEHSFEKRDHTDQFTRLIDSHQSLVGECHQCHTVGSEQDISRVDEVLAFAPLSVASWGVAVRQPASEVMAPADHLRRQILLGSGVLLVTVLLVTSWFIRRKIADPIQALDKASVQLAAGNLGVPIRRGGIDEVARLTANLEQMRVRLEATLEDHRRWNETLEVMVEERTRELTSLYEQLEGKAATCKQLLDKVLTAQEEERTRLARELHDTIGQSLTAIIMATASVEKNLPPDFPGGKLKLARTRSVAAQALQDLRNVISDLRPEILDDLGLVLALRSQAKKHLEPIGVQVQLKASGLEERLPAEVEIVIFRVVQEAITNIARHAQASEAHILLSRKGTRLIVRVEDDGVGFDSDQVMNGRRQAWGIRGMEERITLLGGKFYMGAKPGSGTLVLAEVPLDQH